MEEEILQTPPVAGRGWKLLSRSDAEIFVPGTETAVAKTANRSAPDWKLISGCVMRLDDSGAFDESPQIERSIVSQPQSLADNSPLIILSNGDPSPSSHTDNKSESKYDKPLSFKSNLTSSGSRLFNNSFDSGSTSDVQTGAPIFRASFQGECFPGSSGDADIARRIEVQEHHRVQLINVGKMLPQRYSILKGSPQDWSSQNSSTLPPQSSNGSGWSNDISDDTEEGSGMDTNPDERIRKALFSETE
mmetsp:Transcript_13008/g.23386  ORF Transcript_13008/g.23386 Transcript_13008/m.23386 type:complete len:247 (-) Transcript_13008:1215-1955(-)